MPASKTRKLKQVCSLFRKNNPKEYAYWAFECSKIVKRYKDGI